jgi:RNA polymerase sigma factor (sigma-70 family)
MALTLSLAPLAPTRSEQDLVAGARDGDDRAFEELYSRYRERIAAFIMSKVHDHGRAEDIAQDVFISALGRLRATEREIAFKPWIYEIAKNACIDEFRRSKRAREVSLDVDDELSGIGRGLLSVAPTPPAAVESKKRLEDLQGAFGGLSESHHQVLVMREFEGLSYNEIGARTGMSRQVVESTLFRARRKLTEEYDEIASGRRCEQIMTLIEEEGAKALRSCGIRQRRQLTRHLAHCQPCRRQARLAGVDESLVKPGSIAAKIAALLPFPLWRWPWGGKGAGKAAAAKSGSSQLAGAGSLQSTAATVATSAGSSITLGQAAAAATALVVAGAGGGVVTGAWSSHHASRPATRSLSVSGGHPGSSSAAAGRAGAGRAAAATARHRGAGGGVSRPKVQLQSRSTHGSTGAGAVPGRPGRPSALTKPTAGNQATGTGPGARAGNNGRSKQPAAPIATGPVKSLTGSVKSLTGPTTSTVSGVVKKVLPKNKPVSPTVDRVTQTVHKVLPGSGSITSTVGNTASKVASTVNSTASKVTSTVNSTASKVTATAKSTTQKVASTVNSTASTVNSTASKVTSTVTNTTSHVGSSAAASAQKAGSAASKTVAGLLP